MHARDVMPEQNDFSWGRSVEHIVCRKDTMLGKAFPRVCLMFFMTRGHTVGFLDTGIITDIAARQSTVGGIRGNCALNTVPGTKQ